MLIPHDFDVSMAERKKIIEGKALQTAEKLNKRMIVFLNDVHKNKSISDSKKIEIRIRLLKHL